MSIYGLNIDFHNLYSILKSYPKCQNSEIFIRQCCTSIARSFPGYYYSSSKYFDVYFFSFPTWRYTISIHRGVSRWNAQRKSTCAESYFFLDTAEVFPNIKSALACSVSSPALLTRPYIYVSFSLETFIGAFNLRIQSDQFCYMHWKNNYIFS